MKNFVILIFGLPGSGKTVLANKLAQKIGAVHYNADVIREKYNDWDFSVVGRKRQFERMLELSKNTKKQFIILDFVCPKDEYRQKLNADITVFMDTLHKSRFGNTNLIFERPRSENLDFHFTAYSSDKYSNLIAKSLITFDWKKPTVQMLGRWQPFHDGHLALFKRAILKTGQVAIQVRDCQGWDNKNPFSFEEVKIEIVSKLSEAGYFEGQDYIVQIVPNITNITYGRTVGYSIEEEKFDHSISSISATKIRKSMGY